jgi:hypothetical protein
MVHSKSIFRTAEPTDPRLLVDLPCTLRLSTGQIEATLFNVSYKGMAIRLQAADNRFDLSTIEALVVPEIGEFLVRTRWRKTDQIGFAFESKRGARPLLEAYFAKIGKYPD